MGATSVIGMVVLITLGALVYGVGLFLLIILILSSFGGWRKLAQVFPAPGEPPGLLLPRETIKVGAVRYRWAARVVFSQYGLYLSVRLPGHKPLLIPWQAFTGLSSDTLYWFPAVKLSIGSPVIATLTFYARNVGTLRQFLPPGISFPQQ